MNKKYNIFVDYLFITTTSFNFIILSIIYFWLYSSMSLNNVILIAFMVKPISYAVITYLIMHNFDIIIKPKFEDDKQRRLYRFDFILCIILDFIVVSSTVYVLGNYEINNSLLDKALLGSILKSLDYIGLYILLRKRFNFIDK